MVASLLRPDDLRAPASQAKALAFLRSRAPRFADRLYAPALYLHEQPSAEAREQLLASLDGARILVARMVASIRAELLRSPGAAE